MHEVRRSERERGIHAGTISEADHERGLGGQAVGRAESGPHAKAGAVLQNQQDVERPINRIADIADPVAVEIRVPRRERR